jgi:hypothetical protein
MFALMKQVGLLYRFDKAGWSARFALTKQVASAISL